MEKGTSEEYVCGVIMQRKITTNINNNIWIKDQKQL